MAKVGIGVAEAARRIGALNSPQEIDGSMCGGGRNSYRKAIWSEDLCARRHRRQRHGT